MPQRHLKPSRLLLALALAMTTAPGYSAWPLGGDDSAALPSLAPMLKRAMPAVVNISTKTEIEAGEHPLMRDPFFRHFFEIPNQGPRKQQSSSLGSGVIIDSSKGYVLTNNHVIDKANEIQVTLSDSRHFPAKLIGADPESDLAVVQIQASGLTQIHLADSDSLEVGDYVVAIGNPFGLGQTVTSGIISALGRSGLGIEGYEDFIQTDASINPGNSGGALVNLRGELIGINTAILAPNGGNVGIGFAIPANMAANIEKQLIEHGEIRRGLLGVNVQDLTPDLAQAFDLKQNQGAVVTGVHKDSPAAKAGVEPGDIVQSVNGRKMKNGMDVRNAVGLLPVGSEVRLGLIHKGSEVERIAAIAAPHLEHEDGKKIHPKLSGTQLGNMMGNEGIMGVRVEKIHTASYAYQAGLRPGDIITMANRQSVSSLDDLSKLSKGSRDLLLNIQRGEGGFFLMLR